MTDDLSPPALPPPVRCRGAAGHPGARARRRHRRFGPAPPAPSSEPRASGAPAHGQTYVCPMHPRSPRTIPGDCPICGMQLVRGRAPAAAARAEDRSSTARRWTRRQTSPTPARTRWGWTTCRSTATRSRRRRTRWTGLATVAIDPQRQQLIGLRTAEVTRGSGRRQLADRGPGGGGRDPGPPRQRQGLGASSSSVFVDFVGKPVRRGEPLFTHLQPGAARGARRSTCWPCRPGRRWRRRARCRRRRRPGRRGAAASSSSGTSRDGDRAARARRGKPRKTPHPLLARSAAWSPRRTW